MAKKEQKIMFFLGFLDENVFVYIFRQTKPPLKAWTYVNAVKKHREKIRLRLAGSSPKDWKAAINKTKMVLDKIQNKTRAVTFPYFLSFVCGLASDAQQHKKFKDIAGKIEENLFKLYQIYDPEIKENKEIDKACRHLELINDFF